MKSKAPDIRPIAARMGHDLRRSRIAAVLVGDACASFHSGGTHMASEAEFVLIERADPAELAEVLRRLRFQPSGDRFAHGSEPFTAAFRPGPVTIDGEPAEKPKQLRRDTWTFLGLDATDACRDRLAVFYRTQDRGALTAALAVAMHARPNLERVEGWSARAGHAERFAAFMTELRARRQAARDS